MQPHIIKKFLILAVVVGALFSNSASSFLSAVGKTHWAESFVIHQAFAAVPTYIASGTVGAGTGVVTPGLPAGILTNDILIMAIETANQAISIPTPNGGIWTEITGSPQGTGTAGGTAATRLTIFWSRYNGTQGAPTTSDSGDHQRARIYAFRGVINTGNPWDITVGTVLATASTVISIPGGTTTATDDLIVATVSNGTDTNTAQCGGTWTNASLTGVVEIAGDNTNFGNGGGTCIVTGAKAAAGAFNPTTSSLLTSSTQGLISIALKPQPTTTIGDGTNPSNVTLAPGAAVTDLDNFNLVASLGTDTVTALTVTLSPVGSFNNIGQVDITNMSNIAQCTAITNPASDTLSFTGCTIPVSTTATDFKVRVTPKTHANMPAPPGAQYATMGTVTAFATTNPQLGTDTASATVTIDNLSPGDVTAASGTAGSGQVTLNWTNPVDADFVSVVVLSSAGSAVLNTPVEGATYTVGGTIGTATVACVVTTPTTTCADTGLTNGTAYYYEIFAKDTSGNYSVGVVPTGSPFTPATAITVTSYTNTTETALDYATSCTGCGARIGGGAGFRQSITVTGSGFGALTCGTGNCSTVTNNIKIGTHQIADANITSWTATSITFLTNSNIATDTDTDWGTEFGGASALVVTAGGASATGLNFYVFPQVTSITVPGGFPAESAREYDAGDTDGVITLNGTRFGTGAGSATLVGQSATPTGWGNTAVTLQVPTTIVDTTNTGAVSMTQGTGGNGKTTTYLNPLRILPRITSFNPVSGIQGAAVTVNGNHFCQTGTCPVAFSAADKVTFTSGVVATTFTSWSATAIATAVPAGAVTGNVVVTSATSYTSNGKSFTVDANTTTLATGSDPAATTIAPGATATDVDLFTLQTNGGTESVTSVSVNLSTNSGIGLLAITDNANTVLGSTASPVTGSNVITVSGLTAGTSATAFKVRVTPLSPTAMPAVPGAAYAITAPVTAFAGPNVHAGSDTNTNALTIDNLSPAEVTASTATAGDAQVSLAWTNPADADFHSTVVLRRTTSVVTDVPVEGTTYTVGNIIGASTVACVVATPTAVCTDSGLTNGTAYYYKIFTKDSRVNYSATGVVPTGSPVTPIATQTLTVGTTGTQAVNLNSGTTAQHIGGAGTAAFTLQINNGTSNVTSVKVSETGTVAMANLANPKLYYETATSCTYNGNESNVAGAAPVGETVTFTLPSVAVGVGSNVTCLYFVSDVTSSAAGGQTIDLQITNPSTDVVVSSGVNSDVTAKAIAGTTTVLPQITGYTNSTESALNYAASCTGCGARIGGGAGFRQTIVISGYGFGADPGAGSRDTATNKVEVVGASTNLIDDIGVGNTNVTAWNNTSITITTDSAITGDTDADWGTNFGGVAALKVTAGGQAVPTNLNFYLFPQITSITQPGGFPADSAREYDAGDTDGVITLNGTRFGSSLGTGSVTILGSSATTNSWGNTAIATQVPAAIADNAYTGTVAMQQGTGGNSKTHSYSPLRILPRITSLVPATGSVGDSITVNGNHFCQAGAVSCPTAFSANDKVTFTTATDATVFTSWSATAIVTAVPTGVVTGNVVVSSYTGAVTYTSNGSNFTLASAVPYDPTSLGQFKNAGLTQAIAIGGTASSTPIYLSMTMQAGVSGGTLYPQVEYKAIDTPFVCVGTAVCASDALTGAGVAGPGPATGSVSVTPTDNVYHWQARVKHTKNAVDYYSAWVSFDSINPETATDFKIDTIAPAVTIVSSGSPGTNSATITWSTALEIASSQAQWNTTGTFVANCATNNDCTAITDTSPMVNSHSVTISNLNSGTLYYYRVRSKDAAGNETIDVNNSFTTQTVATPAKTTKQYINGATGVVSGATTYYFTVNVPETVPNVQSAYVEVIGVVSGGTGTVTVQANGSASHAYAVSATNPTFYRFLYPIASPGMETNLNLNDVALCTNGNPSGTPPCNKVTLTPSTVSIDVLSAKIITTYSYTP